MIVVRVVALGVVAVAVLVEVVVGSLVVDAVGPVQSHARENDQTEYFLVQPFVG